MSDELREYYHVSSNNMLLSTVWITQAEAEKMPWLTTVKPPDPECQPPTIEAIEADRLDAAKRFAISVINKSRVRQMNEPITVGGITIDADETAQRNINAKLQELTLLQTAIPLKSLVWRDHDNHIHTFETPDAYQTWLRDVVLALVARRTNLYQKSWEDKDAILSAQTPEQVFALVERW